MSLLISLRSELLKTKRSASLYVAMAAGAFGPFMSLLDVFLGEGVSAEGGKTIFTRLLIEKFQMTGLVMFPLFLILTSTLLAQLEYRNNTWKQVLTSPQAKGNIFAAKFINLQLLILVFLLTNQLMMFTGAALLHFTKPALQVLNQPLDGYRVLAIITNSYLALLAICSIQFWMGLRFKNFIAPIALGIALWFGGTILVLELKAGFASWFPYSFPVYGAFPQYQTDLNTVHWTSAGYAAAFLLVGFIDFKRRSIR